MGRDRWLWPSVGRRDRVLVVQAAVWGAQLSEEHGRHHEGAGGQGFPLQHVGEHVKRKNEKREHGDKKPENPHS